MASAAISTLTAPMRRLCLVLIALVLAACGSTGPSLPSVAGVERVVASDWRAAAVVVDIAEGADLKWFEEDVPLGRFTEARVIDAVRDGVTRGANRVLTGDREVVIEVDVLRFNALGAVSSYVTGGLHNIDLAITVRDGRDNALLASVESLDTDRIALGGIARLVRNLKGRTQRHRVIEQIAYMTSEWLLSGAREREGWF